MTLVPRCCSLAMLLVAGSAATAAEPPGVVLREFIYDNAPFPECHASTIAATPTGLVAAWFGGTYEKHKDVGIWLARRGKDGWTTPVEVANGVQYVTTAGAVHRHPCWNPVLFQMPDGPLLLFYKVGPSPSEWWGMLTESTDGGQTWSWPHRLPEGILGPVKNKPVLLADGTLLCGTSSEHAGWRVHFERTRDAGRTWTRVEPIHDGKTISAIQPSILTYRDGRLQALGRTRNQKIFETWSSDGGVTWSEPQLTPLPNSSTGTDAVTLADGRQLLIYNHTSKGRTPLNLAVTVDGKAWQAAAVLESEPGEYSYPAIIQTQDGLVHITYTWKRQRVRHLVVDPQQLVLQPIVDGVWPADAK